MRVRQSACLTLIVALLLSGLSIGLSIETVNAMPENWSVSIAPQIQPAGILAIVTGGGASLLNAPDGELIYDLPAGSNLAAFGRTADGVWTAVQTDDETSGWVSTADILMFGGDQLPVLAGEDDLSTGGSGAGIPVALPTPTPTREPTATPPSTATPPATATPITAPIPEPTSPSSVSSGLSNTARSQVAVVRSGGTDLVAVPGGESIQSLPTGTALTVSGRTEDSAWLAAVTAQGLSGWAPTTDLVAFNVQRLPIVSASESDAGTFDQGADQPSSATIESPESENGSGQATADEPAGRVDSGITATVAITDSRLNVRSGPDTTYRILAKALPGEKFDATGRNSDSSWLQIDGGKLGNDLGWVATEFMHLSGEILDLPVSTQESGNLQSFNDSDSVSQDNQPVYGNRTTPAPGLSGNLVVQTSLGGDVYVVNLQSGETRYLVSGFDPAISPDGRTVAFTRDGGGHGLYLIEIDGSDERRIYAGGEGLRSPTWSPDGHYVLFSRLSGEWECRDVGYGICLPDNPFLSDFDLVTKPEHGLSRVNVDGGEFRDLPALASAKAASWSPDGIAYQVSTGLEITHDEPNVTTRMLLSAPYYQDPDWQPGGNRIIFQSREGTHWEIFSVNEDGTGLYALTKPVTTLVDELPSNVSPVWSPDGQHILYLSTRDERNDAGDWRLWVMNADGSGQRPLQIDLPIGYTYSAEQVADWGISPVN